MDLSLIYETTELDLANALFRGAELLLYVPNAKVEGEHWTMYVHGISSGREGYMLSTTRGPVMVRTRG